MVLLHPERGLPHDRSLPDVLLHPSGKPSAHHPLPLKTQLRDVPDAHLLAPPLVRSLNADPPSPDPCVNPFHRNLHIHLLRPHNQDSLIASGQQMDCGIRCIDSPDQTRLGPVQDKPRTSTGQAQDHLRTIAAEKFYKKY